MKFPSAKPVKQANRPCMVGLSIAVCINAMMRQGRIHKGIIVSVFMCPIREIAMYWKIQDIGPYEYAVDMMGCRYLFITDDLGNQVDVINNPIAFLLALRD